MIQSEFVAWANEEAARIERGEAQRYHAVLCDPPYGLEFMGKEWDAPHKADWNNWEAEAGRYHNDTNFLARGERPRYHAGQSFQSWVGIWAAALIPLLYPGALVFCFGGTRTWHRLACGFEDAGFQIWDTLMWLHGQGFPKAQGIGSLIDKVNGAAARSKGFNVAHGQHHEPQELCHRADYGGKYEPVSEDAKPWSGHKTAALKPAWEPVLCFKAPTQGKTYAELALEYGSGALNVDGGRIAVAPQDAEAMARCNTQGSGRMLPKGSAGLYGGHPGIAGPLDTTQGRYPANLALECTCDIERLSDREIERLEEGNHRITQSPNHHSPDCPAAMLDAQAGDRPGPWGKNSFISEKKSGPACIDVGPRFVPNEKFGSESGGPSRFFYCAKASRGEREVGLQSEIKNQKSKIGNDHPTVKPLTLCRWLGTLLLPPESIKPRRLLVPFAGTDSEMIGALEAGWDDVTGIEQDAHYREIAQARIGEFNNREPLFRGLEVGI